MQFVGGKNYVLLLARRALGLVFYFDIKKTTKQPYIQRFLKILPRSQINYLSLGIINEIL